MLVDNSYLERLRTFLANRAVFPAEELAKHAGKWVAFSPDGTRVAASAPDPDMLEELLRASGKIRLSALWKVFPVRMARSLRPVGVRRARREVRLHGSPSPTRSHYSAGN
jgi:hypothetical protein